MTDVNIKIEYYKDKAGEWRWRLRSKANGKILAVGSEGYVSKSFMLRQLDDLQFDFEYAQREEVSE